MLARTNRAALLIGVVTLAACDSPVSAPATAVADAPTFAKGEIGRQILMLDNCDPETFPLGACTGRSGGMPFSTFIDQLQKHQQVPGWSFSPAVIHVTRTVTLPVINMGGALHDFTEVAEFGGGYAAGLNQLSGNPVPAPECVEDVEAATLVRHPDVKVIGPGERDHVTFEPGVSRKYQCCFHPWMRAVSN